MSFVDRRLEKHPYPFLSTLDYANGEASKEYLERLLQASSEDAANRKQSAEGTQPRLEDGRAILRLRLLCECEAVCAKLLEILFKFLYSIFIQCYFYPTFYLCKQIISRQ